MAVGCGEAWWRRHNVCARVYADMSLACGAAIGLLGSCVVTYVDNGDGQTNERLGLRMRMIASSFRMFPSDRPR